MGDDLHVGWGLVRVEGGSSFRAKRNVTNPVSVPSVKISIEPVMANGKSFLWSFRASECIELVVGRGNPEKKIHISETVL
ncbi:MAG: hypothetical protein MZV63_19710 [Marinilabiliales bacterium]|nr:hypothetical protein [Marinilabiliales bacterium]